MYRPDRPKVFATGNRRRGLWSSDAPAVGAHGLGVSTSRSLGGGEGAPRGPQSASRAASIASGEVYSLSSSSASIPSPLASASQSCHESRSRATSESARIASTAASAAGSANRRSARKPARSSAFSRNHFASSRPERRFGSSATAPRLAFFMSVPPRKVLAWPWGVRAPPGPALVDRQGKPVLVGRQP